jgi:hypothetical protein
MSQDILSSTKKRHPFRLDELNHPIECIRSPKICPYVEPEGHCIQPENLLGFCLNQQSTPLFIIH